MKDYWLSQICAALGWQGGTIHQVIAEIERTRAALESARNGLQWYRDTYPEADSGADDEMMAEIASILGSEVKGAARLASSNTQYEITGALVDELTPQPAEGEVTP